MRRFATCCGMALVLLAGPAAVQAGPPEKCRRITRQIDHFEDVVQMARDRDDALWEAGTRRHIGNLEVRRARLCPEYAAQMQERERAERAAEQTARLFSALGRAAVTFFTFGAY